MKNETTFLRLVLDLVLDAEFNKLSNEDKSNLFERLEDNYQMRMNISYRTGYTAGKYEGTNELFKLLNNTDASFVMSNSDVELVRTHFQSAKYTITTVVCKRLINSKNPDSKTNEVFVMNT